MKDPVTIMINFLGHQSPKSQSKSEDPKNIKPSDTEAGLPQNSNANNSAIHKDTRDKDKSSASEHPDASTSSRELCRVSFGLSLWLQLFNFSELAVFYLEISCTFPRQQESHAVVSGHGNSSIKKNWKLWLFFPILESILARVKALESQSMVFLFWFCSSTRDDGKIRSGSGCDNSGYVVDQGFFWKLRKDGPLSPQWPLDLVVLNQSRYQQRKISGSLCFYR